MLNLFQPTGREGRFVADERESGNYGEKSRLGLLPLGSRAPIQVVRRFRSQAVAPFFEMSFKSCREDVKADLIVAPVESADNLLALFYQDFFLFY